MIENKFQSIAEQVESVLRQGMMSGRWRDVLPGRERLARELGVSHKTVEMAMRRLVAEGLLVSPGSGRRRQILLPKGEKKRNDLRVRILLYDKDSRLEPCDLELLDRLRMAGFAADFALKTQMDLGMDVGRVARFVEKTPADAWVVMAGAREVLEWFSRQEVPAIAMFGRFTGLPIAVSSPRKAPAMVKSLHRLVELGHRRIVMMVHEERRNPYPALFEKIFLDELELLGIATSSYNLPEWNYGAAGFRDCLEKLFLHTPPTAIIFGESRFYVAGQQHLARRGIHAPEDVSLIADDSHQIFAWCEPAVSHFSWDSGPVIKRVVQWVKNVARGKQDKRQVLFAGDFIEGGTIGPVGGKVLKGKRSDW